MTVEGIAVGGVVDVNTTLQEVLKTALIHDGLASGIHETAKALSAQHIFVCLHSIVMSQCIPSWWSCAEHQVNLIKVNDNKKLGEWVSLCKIDGEGKPRKVVGCICLVVKDYGKESQAKDVIEEYFRRKK